MKRFTWGVLVCLISAMVVLLPACNNAGGLTVAFVQATTQAVDDGQTFNITATVKNDSSNKGVSWSLTGPGMLTNVTTTSVTYNAPPAIVAAAHLTAQDPPQTAMVTAKSNADSSKSATITINLTQPPFMSNQTLAAGTEGTAYSQQVAETGGAGTLSWQISSGSQPAGLTINSTTGVISGTPTGPNGSSTFTVKVTDSNAGNSGPQSAQAQVTIAINLPPAPKINPAGSALNSGTEGVAYNQAALTVSGGLANYTWTVIGNLPAGLTGTQSADTKSFTISGTPTGPNGTSNFQIKVADSSKPTQSDTESYSITINLPAPPKISPAGGALTAGTIGTNYSQDFTVSGGLANFTWTPPASGTLPAGLSSTISPAGTKLTISGKPTGPAGPSNFTLKVTDSSNPPQSDTQNYSLQINNPPPPTITTTQAQVTAAPATVGTAYNFTFQATGFGTLTFTPTPALTDGLSMDSSGHVTGTPSTKGSVSFSLTVKDQLGQSSAPVAFTITVNNPAPPVINTTPAQVPSATVNVPYNFTFQGSGFGTLTWSTNPVLSDNLVLNAGTGQITGTPNTATTLNFSVTLTDGVGQMTTVNGFSITVSTITIAFTSGQAPPSSVNTGASFNVGATVTNDPSSGGVDWTVTCGNPGNANCGSFNPTHTASGATTQFTAPTSVPTGNTVTITASSHTQSSVNVSGVVTVIQPVFIIMFTQSPPSSLAVNGTTNVSATIQNDSNNKGVDWTVTCGNPGNTNCGFFNPTHTASGVATQFTAPSSIPTGTTVTITATTTATPTQNVQAMVTITAAAPSCGSGSESLLKGQYTATLRGFDASGPEGIGLMFDADGLGGVAKGGVGIEDINSNSAPVQQNLAIDSTKSSYSVGSDHRGCLIIVTGTTNQTFRFSLGSISGSPAVASNGHIIEFDTTGSNTAGILRKQDTSVFNASSFAGFSFAFGASGPRVGGGKFGVAGVFTTASSGNIPTGSLDVNDNGKLDGDTTGTQTNFPANSIPFSGSYTMGGNGRGTFTFNVPGTAGVHGILYAVSANELLEMSSDAQNSTTLFVGRALKQSKTSFSTGDLNAKIVVYAAALGSNPGTTQTTVGLVTPNGSGGFSVTLNQNDGGSLSTQSASTGMFSVASDGRVLVSGVGNHNAVLYLVSPNTAFFLNSDGKVNSGFFEPQSGSPFGNGSAKSPPPYAFGTIQPELPAVSLDSGTANFDGISVITGASDDNSTGNGGGLKAGGSISASYSIDSTGTGLVPHSGTSCSFTAGTCDLLFIVISPSKAVLMDSKTGSGNTTPALQAADQ